MVIAVLTIGIVNLLLGYFLAVALERPLAAGWLSKGNVRRQRNTPATRVKDQQHIPEEQPKPTIEVAETAFLTEATAPAPVEKTADKPPPVREPVWNELPKTWVERLQSENLSPLSFGEGALWLIHRSVPECRSRLASLLDRCSGQQGDSPTAGEIHESASSWLDHASQWISAIQIPPTEKDRAVCDELGYVLTDQLIKIHPAVSKCEQLASVDQAVAGKSAIQPLSELVKSTNVIRDHVQELLCQTLQREKRIAEVPAGLELDEATQLPNRLGLEKLADEWIRNDPSRLRLVCGVLVDVDHFANVNAQIGIIRADSVAASLGQILDSLIRKERGFDRVSRMSGQRFLLFFGDTALRNAMYGAERIRANIQATTFKLADASIRFTVSCAVSEWGEQESIEEWIYRLQLLLAEAKGSGRNCTCVVESKGPRVVSPSNAHVQPKEVIVG